MKRCKTCKFWESIKGQEWGWCERASSDSAEAIDPTSLAVAQDYESYKAHLQTHITFGCVQYERKADVN